MNKLVVYIYELVKHTNLGEGDLWLTFQGIQSMKLQPH